MFLLIAALLPAQYVRQFGTAGVNEVGKTILPERNAANALTGNLYIGGNQGGNTLIMRIDGQGNILGQWAFKVSAAGQSDNLNNLRYDRTRGSLLGCGMIPSGGTLYPYVFRFNLSTHTVTWANRFTSRGVVQNVIDAGETIGGVPVIHLFGLTYEPNSYDASYMMMNLNTGVVIPGSERTHRCASTLSEHYATELDPATGLFYSSGRWGYGPASTGYRPNISRASSNGNLQYTRTFLVDSTSQARLYVYDLVLNGANPSVLVSGCFGCNSITNGMTFAISRHNPFNGGMAWARRFDVTAGMAGPGEVATAMLINAAGNYVVLGNNTATSQRLFLAEISPTGTVLWAHSFTSTVRNYISARSTNELVELNGGYYVLATVTNGGDDNILLIKTNTVGQVPGCATTPLTITVSTPTAQQPIFPLAGGPNAYQNVTPTSVVPNVVGNTTCTSILAVEDEIFLEAEADGSLARLHWTSEAPGITGFTLAGGIHPYQLVDLQNHPPTTWQSTHLPVRFGPYYFQVRAHLADGRTLQSSVQRIWTDQVAAMAASSTLLQQGEAVVFHIVGEPSQSASLAIYDMKGQLCARQTGTIDKSGGCEFSIPTAQMSTGVYFAQFGVHTLRFLVY